MLSDVTAPLPNYRFTALYPQALDFVNAVRAYGGALLTALEKSDGDALATLLATTQQQLLSDADQIFEWRVQQAQNTIEALSENLTLGNQKLTYYTQARDNFINPAEAVALTLQSAALLVNSSVTVANLIASGVYLIPFFTFGASGFGGTPKADAGTGGPPFGHSFAQGAQAVKAIADVLDKGATLANSVGKFLHTKDDWAEKIAETNIDIQHTNTQIAGAQLALQVAQQDQANHQEQIANLQKQVDFLTGKFSNQDLYDWMVGQLSDTYFQSYRLAYKMCKQAERCYRYELGVAASSFIQFGYWDSLKKGLLAGETLNHDLRRMQASYLEQNSQRYELSRFISLAALNPNALVALLTKGVCDFDLPESLFDNDYPGHYQRHLVRASLTLVYPNPGKFDNVKGTLTLAKNSVRTSTDLGSGYPRQAGTDPRFADQYAAVPQKIVLGNAQDDPGLFLTSINNNISDQRYLPFEGAGVISSWRFELPTATNEIDLTAVGDVIIHLFYTALDGGDAFKQAVQADNAQNLPTSGLKLFSAQNDFGAPSATDAVEFPLTPWQSFLATPSPGSDQTLVLTISPSKFPTWTRGKTITVTALSVLAVSWTSGNFVLEPQAPLPGADVTLTPVAGVTEPNVASGNVAVVSASLGKWTFKLRTAVVADFHSITKNDIGDVLLLLSFQVS